MNGDTAKMEKVLQDTRDSLFVICAALYEFVNGDACECDLTEMDGRYLHGTAVLLAQLAKRCDDAVPAK